MKHLNGGLLCVVDCETTGPKPGYHDIIEICCLILGPDLEPAKIKGVMNPFNMELQPKRIENIDLEALRVQGKDLDSVVKDKICGDRRRVVKITTNGCDADLAADLFGQWFEKLRLAPFKKLLPIAHNWAFDRNFLIDWLGIEGFEYYFDPRYRDTMSMALYDNDIADWRGEAFDYPKVKLSYVCNILGVERIRAHTAFDDVLATAEVYRRLVQRSEIRSLPKNVIPESELTTGQLEEHINHLQQELKRRKEAIGLT